MPVYACTLLVCKVNHILRTSAIEKMGFRGESQTIRALAHAWTRQRPAKRQTPVMNDWEKCRSSIQLARCSRIGPDNPKSFAMVLRSAVYHMRTLLRAAAMKETNTKMRSSMVTIRHTCPCPPWTNPILNWSNTRPETAEATKANDVVPSKPNRPAHEYTSPDDHVKEA